MHTATHLGWGGGECMKFPLQTFALEVSPHVDGGRSDRVITRMDKWKQRPTSTSAQLV